ncbi:pyrroline-5-carboxylate reductase [Salpingoeca rosetta]|uniref:Pyrroline-5-carboxylate reductase n=1 Tax=Salpingoeca rosetta (strain ATCC 50818 / BSB-021) TaxID=946362 RepID=F2UG44_SALR5|nr:pyrroline-5-carboxylate reductase [Salpingoeca rosetta]EGD75472.1 pyrroline-5-carboxylate reductase [Salpingoeca rosetta]|eukprot:XP_004991929.1 pyrroline-5-carboxylate reductase [Salpingoeca rosetta]
MMFSIASACKSSAQRRAACLLVDGITASARACVRAQTSATARMPTACRHTSAAAAMVAPTALRRMHTAAALGQQSQPAVEEPHVQPSQDRQQQQQQQQQEQKAQPAKPSNKAGPPSLALKGKKMVFLGSGKMAEAMMGGMLNSGAVEATQVTACDPNATRRTFLSDRFHISATANNADAAKGADILILAVKPQTMASVFDGIRDTISKECLVVSIAAGFTIGQIREGLGVERVVRAMPNTPALINQSITSWTFTPEVTTEQRRQAKEFLSTFGEEVLLSDERMLDMATALSGSGPAMCQLMFEAMIDAGVHMGFPRDTSRKLTLHTVRGSVNLALASGEHPSVLKNDITSPGGTTAAALYELERGGMRTVISDAVWAAYRRSRELGGLDSRVGPGRSHVTPHLQLPRELVDNLQQATEAISAVTEEIAHKQSD